MGPYSFMHLEELLTRGEVGVVESGVFWKEARLVHAPSPEHALIGVPVTLHLAGKLSAVAYAEMPVAAGSKVRGEQGAAALDWINRKLRDRRRAGLLRFSLPDLGLAWHREVRDVHAVSLARRFAQALAEQFPEPQAELMRQFHLDMQALVAYLSQMPYLQAATTQNGQ